MHDARTGAEATFWARDAGVFASLHQPQTSPQAWAAYLDGLIETYNGWGIGHIVDRGRLEREGCQFFWLLHDAEGACLGGLRVEGPYRHLDRYLGVAEMAESPDVGKLSRVLGPAVEGGLIEFKGVWSGRPGNGIGAVLSRCMQHAVWWLDVPYAFCVAAAHAEPGWAAGGARRVAEIAPAPFPDERYDTVVLLWDDGHHDRVARELQPLIEAERRYLIPAQGGHHDWDRWHPELLFDFSPRLAEVRQHATVYDHWEQCQAELDELLPAASPHLRDEPAHWVHFPWRNLVLRLAGPDTYWRLRVDRDRYKLTDVELVSLRRRSVGVVGLSVGSSAAFVMAQEGLCGHLRLADYDTLDLTNLNRLSASVVDLGTPKTHLTARRLAELDPYLPVTVYPAGVDEVNVGRFLHGLDAVVEECDSIDMKLLVRQHARQRRIPVVMETSDRGLLDVERFDLEPDRELFHGLVGDLNPAELRGLTTDDKVPHVLAILEADELSAPMAASMVEIDDKTSTWPQLASDVALGSCLVAATLRRLFLAGGELGSGRARLDLDGMLDSLAQPDRPTGAGALDTIEPAPTAHPRLPESFDAAVVTAAGLAPSGGNMQPWRFELGRQSFDVTIAPASQVGMDIGLRGSAVACGAALANALITAAAHARLRSPDKTLDLALNPDRPDLAGRVLLGTATNRDWASLAPLITSRLSNRHYGPPAPLTPEHLTALQRAASIGGGRLCYVPPDELDDLTELWAEADRVRMLSPRLHQEMMSELRRPGIDPLTEGIDERSLELSPADRAKLPILRRPDVMAELNQWDGGRRLGDDTRKRFKASSGLVVFVVEGQSQADYVRGGVSVQRAWLVATSLGLGLHPMSPVFGYANTEDELAEVVRPDRARALFARSRHAYRRIGIEPGEQFVLACRILSAPPPTAISQRADPSRFLVQTPAPFFGDRDIRASA